MKSIDKLAERARTLSSEEAVVFDRVIFGIKTLVFDGSDSSSARRKVLSEIERYLKKKGERPTKENTGDKVEYLRFVRNSLAHKSNVPPEVITLAIPMFWTILTESSSKWQARELSNLLAFAVRSRDDYPADKATATIDVIRHYQTLFKKIPLVERNEVFKELLLSIFVTPQFQQALSVHRPEISKKRGGSFAN